MFKKKCSNCGSHNLLQNCLSSHQFIAPHLFAFKCKKCGYYWEEKINYGDLTKKQLILKDVERSEGRLTALSESIDFLQQNSGSLTKKEMKELERKIRAFYREERRYFNLGKTLNDEELIEFKK
jgi:uncharacterized Zn finger protein